MFPFIYPFTIIWLGGSLVLTYHWYQLKKGSLSKDTRLLYSYGKTLRKEDREDQLSNNLIYEVLILPFSKSWFIWFYDVAIVALSGSSWMLPAFVKLTPFFAVAIINFLLNFFFWESGHDIENLRTGSSVYWLSFYLQLFQVLRRSYECHFISIFSKKGEISFLQLVLGFGYYLACAIALMNIRQINNDSCGSLQVIGVMVYVIGFLIQHSAITTLANLRTMNNNKTEGDYLIPSGGLFELVSNPHYFGEILIYLGIYLASSLDNSYGSILVYVVTSAMLMGQLSHDYYLEKHPKEYPSGRKVVIPFLL